jgi:hypothetical protein
VQGVLVIDVIDPKQHKLIWQGWATQISVDCPNDKIAQEKLMKAAITTLGYPSEDNAIRQSVRSDYPRRRLKDAIVRSVSRLASFSFRSWRLSIVDLPLPRPSSTFT